jgi:hypothetical protein
MKEPIYTHYQIDLKNCNSNLGDYIIVESLEDVLGILKLIDSDLDDDSFDNSEFNDKPQATITGIGMTRKAFQEYLKSNELV